MDGDGDESGGRPTKVTEGEWAGWYTWHGQDPFESLVGPFYSRAVDGRPVCAFRAEARHMNGHRHMHGGLMLSFADFALFALSSRERQGAPCVTVSLNGEFLGPAREGDRVEATGEVTKAGRSLIFVRGLLAVEAVPVLSFSGVIKKVSRRG